MVFCLSYFLTLNFYEECYTVYVDWILTGEGGGAVCEYQEL